MILGWRDPVLHTELLEKLLFVSAINGTSLMQLSWTHPGGCTDTDTDADEIATNTAGVYSHLELLSVAHGCYCCCWTAGQKDGKKMGSPFFLILYLLVLPSIDPSEIQLARGFQQCGMQAVSQRYEGDCRKARMEIKATDTLEHSPLLWALDIHKCLSIHT